MSMTSKRNASLESPVFEREATDRMDCHSIKTEIECPHCFDLMILSSDFDSLSYVCEACGFTLYTTRLATWDYLSTNWHPVRMARVQLPSNKSHIQLGQTQII